MTNGVYVVDTAPLGMNTQAVPQLLRFRVGLAALLAVFLIPIVQLVLLGYAATTDIEHLEAAVRIIAGSARSMGIEVEG